ncbi:MAG: glycoside hydrolase family 15 protein [Candidatus Woesearchaeota archaeon]
MVKNTKLDYNRLIKQHLKILENLQYKSGLFAASKKNSDTGYNKSWLRDNFYECLPFMIIEDKDTVKKTYRALLDIFLKHEYKIDHAIEHKPEHRYEYIHARFNPETFDEFWEEWGNKQNDSIGAILFGIGELESKYKIDILETKDDVRIVNKLVKYLESLRYWKDEDSGMWEEDEEIHASSVGACVAGLKAVSKINHVDVDFEVIKKGKKTLSKLLPRESKKKFVDLALLSLIWPYDVTTKTQREKILDNIEYHLLRKKGVIRYKNDYYYNKNEDGYSEEAEWTFGLSWLTIIYENLKDDKKAKKYLKKTLETVNRKGEVPELYFSNTDKWNDNSPLGWSEALFIIALYEINKKHSRK